MTLIPEVSIPMGKYVVSPSTYLNKAGQYIASVAVSRGKGSASNHRIYRYEQKFASREAARLFAITQGWLQTCSPNLHMC